MYSQFSTAFSPGFGTGSTKSGLKVPSFSPGFTPGTKEGSRPGHVGRPFSPGWYYQLGLKVSFFFFFLFLFSIDDSFWFLNTHSTANNIRILHVYNVRTFYTN